jgi:hypothetical protein
MTSLVVITTHDLLQLTLAENGHRAQIGANYASLSWDKSRAIHRVVAPHSSGVGTAG